MAAVVGAMAASSVEIEEFINGALVAWVSFCYNIYIFILYIYIHISVRVIYS